MLLPTLVDGRQLVTSRSRCFRSPTPEKPLLPAGALAIDDGVVFEQVRRSIRNASFREIPKTGYNKSVGTVEEKFFDLHFDANVKGLFFTVQKGLPLMNDGGAIILTGSIADIKGFPGMSVYSATKAAVRSFAGAWTNELRERRIRVNVISPGHIDTPIMESLQHGNALIRMKEEFAKAVPLGRMGDPDEIAKAVSFLASDEASYVSGIELFVDGGVAQI